MCAKKLSAANKIAVAVATVAVAGSVGTGVYAAVQGTPDFDANGFASSYGKDSQDEQKGFRAQKSSSDAAANRHRDDADNDEQSAQNNSQKDAFSDLPDNGDGTTAMSVDSKAKPGTTARFNDNSGTDDGSGNGGPSSPTTDGDSDNPGGNTDNPGTSDNPGGNTDNPGGGDNTGGDNGNTDKPSDGDNSGGSTDKPGDSSGGNTDKPSDGDNSGGSTDKPSDGDNTGGSTGGGSSDNTGGGVIEEPQKPTEDRGNTENPFTPEKDQVTEDSNYKPGGSGPSSSSDVLYFPNIAVKDGYAPCVGEEVSSWDLFCALDTVYFDLFSSAQYMWSCSDEEAYKDYDLFKVTGISYQDPDDPDTTKTIYFEDQDKITIPDTSFDILFTYKFAETDEPIENSLMQLTWDTCTPAYARVYLVQEEKTDAEDSDADSKKRPTQKVLKSYTIANKGEYLSFWDQAKTLLTNEGALGDESGMNSWSISKLITGFHDVDTGEEVDSAGNYSPTPGYHTIAATFDDVAEGTEACLHSEYGNLFGQWTAYCAQVLTHVDAAAIEDGLFTVQKGIHAVQADTDGVIESLVLPDTVKRVGDPLLSSASGTRLTATDNYVVDSSNQRLESVDGCIIDRSENRLIAIPTGKETVTVPDGVSMVDLPAANKLKLVELEASSADALPDFNFSNLDESCVFEVQTNDILAVAQEKYKAIMMNGNVIRSKEGTSQKLIDDISMGMEDDKLTNVPDNGATAITLRDIKSIAAGAFAGNESVKTVFLKDIGDCTFEPGCFAGGAVQTVVCESDAQAELVRASMSTAGGPEETPDGSDDGDESGSGETPGGSEGGSVEVSSSGLEEGSPVLEETPEGSEETPEGPEEGSGSEEIPAEESSIEVLSAEDALTTDDGNYQYLTAGDEEVILLKALNDDITEFTGVLDNDEHVSIIGPEAFAGNQSLRYLNLDASVTAVSQKAFVGCSGLREAFFDTRDSLTFGSKAFYGCDSIEIFVSNAATAVGNTGTFLSDSCSAWCPTDGNGYDENHYGWFDEASNVTSYEGVRQSDGSFVLYGCTDEIPWLCIEAPSELPAEVTLPDSTIEVYNKAFAGAKGPEVVAPPSSSEEDKDSNEDTGEGDKTNDKTSAGDENNAAEQSLDDNDDANNNEVPSGGTSSTEGDQNTGGESGSGSDQGNSGGGESTGGDNTGGSGESTGGGNTEGGGETGGDTSSGEEETFTPVNPFTVNLGDLDNLLYIDESAFDGSALAGDVYLGERGNDAIHLYRNAFNNCTNITSFTCDALHLDLGETAIAGCTHMKTVKLACEKYTHATISAAAFGGCSSLESIEFTAETDPVELTKIGDGWPFKFTYENYEDKVKIIVPDSMKELYLRDWVYSFTSYDDYDQLLETAEQELKYDADNPCPNPTDAQIVQRANEHLLADENYLRARMGMDSVEETTLPHREVTEDGVSLWLDDSDQAVIVKVAPGTESIDLNDEAFAAWDEIVLQEGAFADAGETLKTITLSDKVKVIKKDTFTDCKDITLKLANDAPMLQGGARDIPFAFGAEKIKIEASEAVQKKCLEEWPRQMLGFDTEWALDDYAFDVYFQLYDWDTGEEPLKTDVSKAINDVLAAQENTVRSWFGLDPLADDAAPTWAYTSTIGAEPKPSEGDKEETEEPGKDAGSTGGATEGIGGETSEVDPPTAGDGTNTSESEGDTGDVDKKDDAGSKNESDKKDADDVENGSDNASGGSSEEGNEQGTVEESL